MKNGLLKSFSLILALCMMLTSMSIVVIASDVSKLDISGGSVELDVTNAGTVTISVVAKEELTFYGIEGSFDINEGENKYFTLKDITSDCIVFENTENNFADVETGEVVWVDESFTASATAAGTNILTATYEVAANTPDGKYTLSFTSSVFTGATGDPDETDTVFEATITVTHKCKAEEQAAKKAECEIDGWKAYYQCPHCGKCYIDAAATDLIADIDAWKLADGKIPAISHKDENKDHVCENECGKPVGECVDTDKDHKCDYGCGKDYGTHEDTDKNHVCDHGCSVAIGECADTNNDHACDYGCDKVHGVHEDIGKDHLCDYGCAKLIGKCEDTDFDHKCDYGCTQLYGLHKDGNNDHVCDYGCKEAIGACEDKDPLDHKCDYGCGKAITACKDCLKKTEAVPAYCETPGNTEYYTCTVCGKFYSDALAATEIEKDSWIIKATDHKWSTTASYTNNGNGTHTANYTCDNNAEHTYSDAPAAHVYVEGFCVCGADESLAGYMKGDVNLDGEIDSEDLTILARHIAKIEHITDLVALDNADITSDGDISSDDLTKLARHVAKIESIS